MTLSTRSVNVLQGVYLTQYALPYLNASQGIIVPVSSAAGRLWDYAYHGTL